MVLLVVTLFLGWLVWSAIVWSRGQSPGKQILHMRVVSLRDDRKASWGRMFVREIPAKFVVGVVGWFTLGFLNLWLVWDKSNQELWDKVADTIVVDDHHNQLA